MLDKSVQLNKAVSILINSCDKYSDLWDIFFYFFKKNWNTGSTKIYFNTETKKYIDEKIIMLNCRTKKYGKRLIKALKKINTKFVILLLDDFFLRNKVDNFEINKIIDFMNIKENAVCFNSEAIKTQKKEYCELDGYKRVPNGTKYILNLQAGIWNRLKLIKYLKRNVSPWEWEEYCNLLTLDNLNDCFYCRDSSRLLFDYGHYKYGDIFGVFRSKWVVEDVVPLFEKENIKVDFKKRGIYSNKIDIFPFIKRTKLYNFNLILRCLGLKHVLNCLKTKIVNKRQQDYFTYLQNMIDNRNI